VIVLVLVVIWIVALAPFVLRKLSEHQLATSVTQFRRLTGMFGRARAGVERAVAPLQQQALSAEEERRLHRQRARLRAQRRRRVFTWLLGFGGFALVFGAIPALRTLWDLAIVDVLLIAAYIGSLAYFTHLEMAERERQAMRNVYPIAPLPDEVAQLAPQRVYATAGGHAMPAPIALRPAFRIVEAPN